ncbi:YggS family pyridoxal phosphate-dependent enzyme [Labedaea rhizosphaerae]|uniref:Pyridoxal phosphate homeostasis protein n=1 Tax=Labedaea rhizosphaerae TaxID=598644 RepID=A0A4R6SDP0_LABRH|nr:YggS family pyridoxal phosphate-dependent enzyme [Labedaea rhizosphaerae]TDP97215.1 hypothetical protein EV186_103177 [Labedaea rhizosphaerae]
MSDRLADLADSLRAVRERISAACAAHDRDPAHVRLLAVTKTFPASDAALLTDLGLTEFGENREQEASAKAGEVASLRPDVAVRWHMVGHLQRNKARSVARWAAEVQSVDSARLADALAKATRAARDAGERDTPLDVLVQVSIDGDPARGGCPIPELPALLDGVTRTGELRLRGLMTVAPLGMEPDAAFDAFHQVAQRIRVEHPNAVELSCGMSNDLESAIAHGSTCVRVGTALLGGRGLASP